MVRQELSGEGHIKLVYMPPLTGHTHPPTPTLSQLILHKKRLPKWLHLESNFQKNFNFWGGTSPFRPPEVWSISSQLLISSKRKTGREISFPAALNNHIVWWFLTKDFQMAPFRIKFQIFSTFEVPYSYRPTCLIPLIPVRCISLVDLVGHGLLLQAS